MFKQNVCAVSDIVVNSGRAALVNGAQIALFRLKTSEGEKFFALDNFCPFAQANVLSRGIVGSLKGKLVVASPVYKQHFDLETGVCLEDEAISVSTYQVIVEGGQIAIGKKAREAA